MQKTIQTLLDHFKKKVSLLLVDDSFDIRQILTELFSSPLFSITGLDSSLGAQNLITSKTHQFHCWILDIAMEEEMSGILLMERKITDFPFVLMLSGMRSMRIATRAIDSGALMVFDKDPSSIEELHRNVCSFSALGYILKGSNSKYLSTFRHLCASVITTPEQWADVAFITIRQLERICTLHCSLTPRFVIPLYYTIAYLLSIDESGNPDVTMPFDPELIDEWSYFVLKNIDKYRTALKF